MYTFIFHLDKKKLCIIHFLDILLLKEKWIRFVSGIFVVYQKQTH